jgi:hypothetical protein
MEPRLGETIYLDLPPLVNPTTGVPSDADSLPTAKVYEDGDDTPVLAPTVVKRAGTTGEYYAPVACTAGNGFEAGKSYNVYVEAAVATLQGKAKIASFQVRSDVGSSAVLSALGSTPIPVRNQDSVTAPTYDDAFLGAWVDAFGKESRTGRSWIKRRPDSTTPVRTFALNSATNPTDRR